MNCTPWQFFCWLQQGSVFFAWKKSGRESLFLALFHFFTEKMCFSRACFSIFLTFFTPGSCFHVQIFGFLHGQKFVFTSKNLIIFTGSIIFSRALFEPTSPLSSRSSKRSYKKTQEILRKRAIRGGRGESISRFFWLSNGKKFQLKFFFYEVFVKTH